MPVRSAIIPNLRYADAPKAIAFLRDCFGFVVHATYADPVDPKIVAHAQLLFEGQMVMLSSAQPSAFAQAAPMLTVAEAGGNTQSLYITLDDVDGHCERARAGGADIFMEPADADYGGRGYSARDLEGNVWSFGSYDPFAQ